jgi:hypothetical protein
LEPVVEEGAEVIGQGMDVDEELRAAGDPLTLARLKPPAGTR